MDSYASKYLWLLIGTVGMLGCLTPPGWHPKDTGENLAEDLTVREEQATGEEVDALDAHAEHGDVVVRDEAMSGAEAKEDMEADTVGPGDEAGVGEVDHFKDAGKDLDIAELFDTSGGGGKEDTGKEDSSADLATDLHVLDADVPPSHCPNGYCEENLGETSKTCPSDCCKCGDGRCDTAGCNETMATCPADCSGCGDGQCAPGETPMSCPIDCCGYCGDGKCIGFACDEPSWCLKDCGTACGNKECDLGETALTCPEDCHWKVCGDGVCSPEDKADPEGCPKDCGTSCGNGECESGEDWLKCPIDCGFCGDGYCVLKLGENAQTCPKDCT